MAFDGAVMATAETLVLTDCLGDEALAELTRDPGQWAHDITGSISPAALAASSEGLRKAFDDVLQIPVGAIFKAAALRLSLGTPEYTAPENEKSPGTLALAPMVIDSSHHPAITMTCAGVSVTMHLDVEVSLDIDGAQLVIEDDRIVGARTGTAKGTASVTCLKAKLLELQTREFRLPGELRFERPVHRTPDPIVPPGI